MSDDFCCDEEFDCGDFFMDDEYSEKSGLKMESLSKKGNLVEYDSDKKIAHFFPTKSKGFLHYLINSYHSKLFQVEIFNYSLRI